MGRTLPWLVQGSSSNTPHHSTKRAVPGKPANRSPKRLKRDDDDGGSSRSSTASDAARTSATSARPGSRVVSAFKKHTVAGLLPSSSPPPLEEPVEEEFMRDGLEQDDIYMMVEDEFYDVARMFTAHIHRREYDRLRREARERNDSRTTNIARPVDGRTALPRDVKIAKERQVSERMRRKDLASVLHRDSETEDDADKRVQAKGKIRSWHGTLGGLMDSPSKASKSLMGLHGPSINSRAAAGFKEAQVTPSKHRTYMRPLSKDELSNIDSEDDLDASPSIMPRRYHSHRKQAGSVNAPSANRRRLPSTSSLPPAIDYRQLEQHSEHVSSKGAGNSSDERITLQAATKLEVEERDDDFFKPRPLVSSRRNRGAAPKE